MTALRRRRQQVCLDRNAFEKGEVLLLLHIFVVVAEAIPRLCVTATAVRNTHALGAFFHATPN